jgi:hypothetical protein
MSAVHSFSTGSDQGNFLNGQSAGLQSQRLPAIPSIAADCYWDLLNCLATLDRSRSAFPEWRTASALMLAFPAIEPEDMEIQWFHRPSHAILE